MFSNLAGSFIGKKKYLVRENIPGKAYGIKDSLDCQGITCSKQGYFWHYQAKSALCAGF